MGRLLAILIGERYGNEFRCDIKNNTKMNVVRRCNDKVVA
jgi:hypothetical protein